MKYLKYALIFFFVVDLLIFFLSQFSPEMLIILLPQFAIDSVANAYPRLVGVLFLALGLARLYGGLYMNEKGAFMLSMWSWVVELVYTISELARGTFQVSENLMALVLAPIMLIWSIVYYRRTFN